MADMTPFIIKMTNMSIQIYYSFGYFGHIGTHSYFVGQAWVHFAFLCVQVEDISEIAAKWRAHIYEEGSLFNYCLFKLPFPHTNTENYIMDCKECGLLINFAGNIFGI